MDTFKTHPGFCPFCGSILPTLGAEGNVTCYNCKQQFQPDVFGNQETKFTIHFNSYDPEKLKTSLKKEGTNDDETEGPVVDRVCSKCGHEKMSYATLQLRSADEGQTVFFTCLKCKYKESENS